MKNQQSGFTLVELSIVLVIIGLIVGGITAGSSMIHAAELRSVITDHERYQTAVMTFKDKYFQIPGDMANATKFWGVAHATAATCVTTASTGTETCDGNGDGRIVPSTGSNEYFRFWQHLANAGLINGSFNGIAGSGGNADAELLVNINSPSSKLSNAGWFTYYLGSLSDHSLYFDGLYYGNAFIFGTDTAASHVDDPAITPEDAWNIDKKIDDGKPAAGKLFALNYSTCTNAANSADITADYDLASTSIGCALVFRKQF